MLVRLAGNTTGVHHQRATLAKLASCEPVSSDVWLKLRQSDPAGGVLVRVSRRPSELARLWSIALTSPDVDAHATLARGTVRLRLTNDRLLDAFDPSDRRVFEEGSRVTAPSNAISERMRDAFDPARILNRGILGEDTR